MQVHEFEFSSDCEALHWKARRMSITSSATNSPTRKLCKQAAISQQARRCSYLRVPTIRSSSTRRATTTSIRLHVRVGSSADWRSGRRQTLNSIKFVSRDRFASSRTFAYSSGDLSICAVRCSRTADTGHAVLVRRVDWSGAEQRNAVIAERVQTQTRSWSSLKGECEGKSAHTTRA